MIIIDICAEKNIDDQLPKNSRQGLLETYSKCACDLAYVAVWTPLNQSSGDNPLLLALPSPVSLPLLCQPHPIYLSTVLSLQSRASAALLSFIRHPCRSLSPLRSLSFSFSLSSSFLRECSTTVLLPCPSIALEFRSVSIAKNRLFSKM